MRYSEGEKKSGKTLFLTSKQIRKVLFFCFFVIIIVGTTGVLFKKDLEVVDTKYLNKKDKLLSSLTESSANSQEFIDFGYYGDQIENIYFPNIVNHIKNFSNFGSRVTGYPGYEHSIEYIQDFFRNQNLTSVQTVSYPHLIPLDLGTKIVINGANITVHALIPNSVHTSKISSGGLSGTLIYGGSGTYQNLDGKKIENSIVVLEFNTQDNWVNVASLGGKAVIFLPPDDTDKFEAKGKTLDIPLEFPRLYIENETAASTIRQFSKQPNQNITLYSEIEWVNFEAKNIMGLLPGLDDEIIVISAYFDSSSVVPSIAPGADEACGIATLLELIRIMREEKITPQTTILFLALSGHNQAAAGAREFVYQNYDLLNRKGGIKLFLSLDLSASGREIALNPYGYLYKFDLRYTLVNNLYDRLRSIGEDFFLSYAPSIRDATNHPFTVKSYVNLLSYEQIGSDPLNYPDISYLGDHEPFIASNVLALSIYTASSDHRRFNTPLDLPNHLQLEELKSQVVYLISALVQLVHEDTLRNYFDLEHKEFSLTTYSHVGFGAIEGYSKEFNETTAGLTNVAGAVIRVTSRDIKTGIQGIHSYYTKTDEHGYYQIRGISSSRPDNPLKFSVEAYVFDSEGKLIKANDLGVYNQVFKSSSFLNAKKITVNPIIFKCGTIAFFRVLHPYSLVPSAEIINFDVLDLGTRSILFSYGHLGAKSVSLVFIPPGTPSILVGTLPDGVLGVYATNSSVDRLRGNGYLLQEGEYTNLGLASFTTLKDIQSLTQAYITRYTSFNIYDNRVEEAFQLTSDSIKTIFVLKEDYRYSQAIEMLNNAQIWAYSAHKQARSVISGGISSTLLFAFLLIPFSFILSQLLFDINSGGKMIIAGGSIYSVAFFFFYLIHPGFQLVPHLLITLLGIINLVSVILVILFLSQEGFLFLKMKRKRILGSHFIDMSRMSAFLIALKIGFSEMKKYKYRTLIYVSSISLLTFSLTLFTSASALISNHVIEVGIPIGIAILMLINTSISIVYMAKREIYIFTSLGSTPTHIAGLFLTEFLVSALIGSILGYLGGITCIRIFLTVGIIPNSLSVNYSSDAVVTALVVTAAGMLVSAVYPLKMSGQMSVPSRKRTWELTVSPEEEGSVWNITLPVVTATELEAGGILLFLWDFFRIYESAGVGGSFSFENLEIESRNGKEQRLTAIVQLEPFDMGIKQAMHISKHFDEFMLHWTLKIRLIRLEGILMAWEAAAIRFVGDIRKQLLIWKFLPRDEKTAKIEQFKKLKRG